MKVLVTGASGFTGSFTVQALLEKKIDVRCFVRCSSCLNFIPKAKVEIAFGDLNRSETLEEALRGTDAIVNIASLGFGHASEVVSAIKQAGVKRCLFISTTAIYTQLNAASKGVRMAAERTIVESGLDYTILRPTMIYGSSRDRNIWRLIKYLDKFPIIPIFGSGNNLQQPVYVGDVAQAITKSLQTEVACGKSYNIAGANPLTYNEMIDTVSSLLGRKINKIHLPVKPVTLGLSFMEKAGITFPINTEQILRLNEDKCFDYSKAIYDFGFKPRTFLDGVRLELEELRDSSGGHKTFILK
jgi:nucleoside-diphosphate-sugar epimerase